MFHILSGFLCCPLLSFLPPYSLGTSSQLCSMQLGRLWVRQNTTVFLSYLLRWRHVSATVGHPQVTKCTMRKTLQCMIIGCVTYSKLSTRSVVVRFTHIELILCLAHKVLNVPCLQNIILVQYG